MGQSLAFSTHDAWRDYWCVRCDRRGDVDAGGNDVKHGLFPEAFFVVDAGVIVVAALVSVLVPLFPVGLPLPDDGFELLALPVPLLSLLPESPDPDVDDDGELLLLGVEEVGIPLLLEDDV